MPIPDPAPGPTSAPDRTDGVVRLEPLDVHHAAAFAEASERADDARRWMGAHVAPRTAEEATAFAGACARDRAAGTRYVFAVTETSSGRFVGLGLVNAIHPTHRFANVGYWIRPDAAGRGYATAAARLLVAFALGPLGLTRAEFVIEPDNAASRRVAEKAGAVCEGLLRKRLVVGGRARDALVYSVVREDAGG